jgi:hypothetical protein
LLSFIQFAPTDVGGYTFFEKALKHRRALPAAAVQIRSFLDFARRFATLVA